MASFRSCVGRVLQFTSPAWTCPYLAAGVLVLLASMPSYGVLPLKPYRVLVLADARARDGSVFRDAGELGDVLALLSFWGIPHDMLRLDTRMLREEDLTDSDGRAIYGVAIWAVRTDLLPREFQEEQVLGDACRKHHIGLIAFGSRIDVPIVREILGLRFAAGQPNSPSIHQVPHFITRNEPSLQSLSSEPWCTGGPAVEPMDPSTEVLLHRDGQLLLTARTLDMASMTRAVWLGGDANHVLRGGGTGLGVRLFQRALVWSLGAMVVHGFDNSLLLRMDDPGAAQSSYLRGWNYPSLSAGLIRRKILAPLQKYHARLDVFCCPGYVDAKTRSVLHSEQVNRVDAFGNRQDIRSMFAALREGQAKGLIEIGSHGWTHLDPDLSTPLSDGSCWSNGTISSQWAEDGWYGEFYDVRRNKEIPPEIQLLHLRTSCQWLEAYFGRRPLTFCPPGHDVSGDSCGYAKPMAGDVRVQLDGVEPNATYNLFAGEANDWIPIGEFQADDTGAVHASLAAPSDLWIDARGHFTINRVGRGTQFIAGPIHEALGFDLAVPVRDRKGMSPVEQDEFPEASQSCHQGKITGHLKRETYQPPTRSAACTYQAAGRAGLSLAIDTACHCLDGEQVTTLRMVPVECFPEDITPAMLSHVGMPTVFRFHDRDLVLDPDFLIHVLKSLSAIGRPPTYLSAEELAGYLHAKWTLCSVNENELVTTVDFGSPACRYLRDHDSNWTVLANDEVLSALDGASGRIAVGDDSGANPKSPDTFDQTKPIQLRVRVGGSLHTFVLRGQ